MKTIEGFGKIICGYCIKTMSEMPDNSIATIVTDPPYGLEFMGKEWDSFKEGKRKSFVGGGGDVTDKTNDAYMRINKTANRLSALSVQQKYDMQKFFQEWATECLRVLKPGGFLLSFGGTRTYHRMVCGIEEAGFEIRDTIMWIYGSGFPKSLNIGKQVDKIQGNDREYLGESNNHISDNNSNVTGNNTYHSYGNNKSFTKGNSEWEGWGTALKPAVEPIVVARKPLSEKNVALNVLKWGTGGINIDGCRIGTIQGRFPANIILDEEAGRMLDELSGETGASGKASGKTRGKWGTQGKYGKCSGENMGESCFYGDKGGASRFFYTAKASKSERNFGLENLEAVGRKTPMAGRGQGGLKCKICGKWKNSGSPCICENPDFEEIKFNSFPDKNSHPTVKPLKLMQYLVRLVTPKGGIVLDPFAGTGTTIIACIIEGLDSIGIEKESEYVEIARARLKPYLEQKKLV